MNRMGKGKKDKEFHRLMMTMVKKRKMMKGGR